MSDTYQSNKSLPTVPDLLLNISLYQRFEITEENAEEVASIEDFGGPLDAFCTSITTRSPRIAVVT